MLNHQANIVRCGGSEGGHLDFAGIRRRGSSARGFSLVELLVVMSIILAILSLGVVGMVKYMSSGIESQTRVVLKQLSGTAAEYQGVTRGLTVPYTGGYPAGTPDDSIKAFFSGIQGAPTAVEVSQRIAVEFSGAGVGAAPSAAVDGWGVPIRYYPGGGLDATGKGMPQRDMPYFASAGEDGEWGTVNAATGEPMGAARDNLYSFEVD